MATGRATEDLRILGSLMPSRLFCPAARRNFALIGASTLAVLVLVAMFCSAASLAVAHLQRDGWLTSRGDWLEQVGPGGRSAER